MSLLTLKDLTMAFGWLCTAICWIDFAGWYSWYSSRYYSFAVSPFLLCATRIHRTGRKWIGLSRGSPWVRWGKHICSAEGGEWCDLLESDPCACRAGMPIPSSSQRLSQILFNLTFSGMRSEGFRFMCCKEVLEKNVLEKYGGWFLRRLL